MGQPYTPQPPQQPYNPQQQYAPPPPAQAPVKKRGFPKLLLIGGLIVIVVFAIAAATGGNRGTNTLFVATPTPVAAVIGNTQVSAEPTSAPSVPKLGDTTTVGSWEVTVEKIEMSEGLDYGGSKDQLPKGKYILVYATAKNITNKQASVNSFDYKLVDETNAEFSSCSEFACFLYPGKVERDSFNTEVPPRTTTKLLAIFDVATDSKSFVLQIEKDTLILLGGL